MWRKTALAAIVLGIAALAPAQSKPAGSSPAAKPQDKVIQILRTPNKAQVNHYVSEALEIKNTNPFNIVNFFWAVTSREDGGLYCYANPDGKSGYIVAICPEYQLATLRTLAKELDRPNQNSAPGSVYIYHRMKHRNASDPGFLGAAGFSIGASGVLVPDVETNSVLIYDAPEGAKAMDKLFTEDLDKPLQQVELGVNIYEIDVNNDGTLGLDYEAWKNGPGQVLGQVSASGSYLHASGIPRTHFNASSGGVFLDYPSAFFDALVEKGKAVSLVKTKVAGLNKVPAELTSDEQVIFYKVKNVSSTKRELTGDQKDAVVVSNLEPDIKSVDTGVTLKAVPTVGEGMVNMALNLSVVTNTGYDGTGAPLLSSRQIANTLAVAPGDEIVFGGLVRERKIQTTRKVPGLGSIPVIGYLFGGEITTSKKTVVVATVKPLLVSGSNNVTADDTQAVTKASGDQVVVLPQTEFCFEQNVPLMH